MDGKLRMRNKGWDEVMLGCGRRDGRHAVSIWTFVRLSFADFTVTP